MHFTSLINAVKQRRESLKVNQERLADLSEISLRTIKQFESGKGNPTLKSIAKIADALGMELVLRVKEMD